MASKDVKQFLRRIEQQGWSWYRRKSGHLRLDGPNGEVVFTSVTPGDRKSLRNLQQDMRRETRRKCRG